MSNLVCKECGKLGVQKKAWTDINTGLYVSDVSDCDIEDNWCPSCEKHVVVINEKDYKIKAFRFTSTTVILAINEETAEQDFADNSTDFAANATCEEVEG